MKMLGFAFTIFFLCVPMLFSQNWFVGASASVRLDYDSMQLPYYAENETARIEIIPEIGYKFSKFDFGISPIFQYQYAKKGRDFHTDDSTTTGLGLGLFSRYKFVTFFDKLSILGRMDLNYIFSWRESSSYEFNEPYEYDQRIGLSVSPVLEFKLLDNLTLYSSVIGRIFEMTYINSINGIHFSERHRFNIDLPSVYDFSLTRISFGVYITF
jgi:hypothetical protein